MQSSFFLFSVVWNLFATALVWRGKGKGLRAQCTRLFYDLFVAYDAFYLNLFTLIYSLCGLFLLVVSFFVGSLHLFSREHYHQCAEH